jgi:hypothetical protein
MLFQPGQVPRLTPLERIDLDGWSFTKDYKNHQDELIDLARSVYATACIALNGRPPNEAQFHSAYTGSLLWSKVFLVKIVHNKKHLQPSLYPHYAGLLAKYVREHDWTEISSVPCPP